MRSSLSLRATYALSSALLFALIPVLASADEYGAAPDVAAPVAAPAAPNHHRIAVVLEQLSFDKKIAEDNGIGANAYSLGVGYAGTFSEHFLLNAGALLLLVDDKDPFSQEVEGSGLFNNGDRKTADSSIDAGGLYAEAGMQLPLTASGDLTAGVLAGYRWVDISRQITNCSNCRSDSIDVSAATYFRPEISYRFSDLWRSELSYIKFNGDKGMSDAVQLNFIWGH